MAETAMVLNVHVEAVTGREEEVAAQFKALLAPTRGEAGCIEYKVHRDPQDPKKFMLYEKFKDQEALDAHVSSPHFKKFLAFRAEGKNPIANETVTRWASLEAS